MDVPNWDPLWFLDGHPMRKELDRVMEEFVMDGTFPNSQLDERSYREFQSMIEIFCNENGERFWGRNNREHLGSGAPVWPDKSRSITMALRWEFREVEERLRQKLSAEAKQRERAGDRMEHQQAITDVENPRPRPRYTDNATTLARLDGGVEVDELMHPERQERMLLDNLENVLNPPNPGTLGQRSPNVKREWNMSFGNNGERENGNALLLAKFREITQDGRRKPKRDARNALQGDEETNAQSQVVVKKPKRLTTQSTRGSQRELFLKTHAPPKQLQPSEHQQRNTTLHFFLSDPSLGAIPISLQKCMSRHDFLEEALTAWRGLEPASSAPTLISVRFDWAPVPMVLKWKDKTGFGQMLEAIAAAPCWQQLDHHCNVQVHGVKCKA